MCPVDRQKTQGSSHKKRGYAKPSLEQGCCPLVLGTGNVALIGQFDRVTIVS